jgi:prephenate dehydrogenase
MAVKEIMEIIGPRLNQGALVTDTGSTKREVMNWAREFITPYADFVGGHPMAGKESSGPEEAGADLFEGKPYCLVPDGKASTSNVEILVGLITAMGANPYFIDESEHDSFVAAVSHVPFVLSAALVSCVARSPQWNDISRLASSGFRDVSRLASGNPIMHRDICVTNRDYIGYWMDAFIAELLLIKNTIMDKDASDSLTELFADSLLNRDNWLSGSVAPSGRTDYKRPNVPSLAGIMFGEKMTELVFGSENDKDKKQIR